MQNLDIALRNIKTSASPPLKLSNMKTLPQNTYMFIYCLSGSFMFFAGDEPYIILEDQLVLLSPRFIDSCWELHGSPLSVLVFPLDAWCHGQNFFEYFALEQDPLVVTNASKEKVVAIYNEMMSYSDSYSPQLSQLAYNASAMELCSVYMEARIKFERSQYEFSDVISYMLDNLDKDLSLDELSKFQHYDPIYFSRKFKEKTGISPIKYVSLLRVQKAAHLLYSTTLPILDIAKMFGFSNIYYFRTFFSKYIGLSPESYRLRFSKKKK